MKITKTANLVLLHNGESIDPTTVKAIRKGDPVEPTEHPYVGRQVPRVIIDYVLDTGGRGHDCWYNHGFGGGHFHCMVIDCKTIQERDRLATDLNTLFNTPNPHCYKWHTLHTLVRE